MMRIRREEPGDAEGIGAVHRAAFPTPDEALLVDALRSGGHLPVSLVAVEEGQVLGHIAFSPVTINGQENDLRGIGLAPVAVHPSRQSRGIGSALIRHGLEACRELGYGFVVLLGHPEFYARFGFGRASDRGLTNEYGANEAFQVLELIAGSLPPGGLVQYGPEFGRFA